MATLMLLANEGVDSDLKDYYGATPLSIAVRNCREEVVKLLLATGRVNVKSPDCFGRTPLWWARKAGNADIAQLLFDCAETRDISACESVTLLDRDPASNDEESGWCDVCTLETVEDEPYYECGICNEGDLIICLVSGAM